MKYDDIARALMKSVEPFVRDLTAALVDIAAKSIAEQLDAAKAHAIAKLREQLEGTVRDDVRADRVEDRPVVSEGPRPARARRARVVPAVADRDGAEAAAQGQAEDEAPPAVNAARTNTCSKCGAIGFTARTCGRTHNVEAEPAPAKISSPPPTVPVAPIGSRGSKPPRLRAVPATTPPPPGWTAEEDRRDEFRELSDLHRHYR